MATRITRRGRARSCVWEIIPLSSDLWEIGRYKDIRGTEARPYHRFLRLYRPTEGLDNVRKVLARDIKELRRVYPGIASISLQGLIQSNKTMYPIEVLKTSI
jgi:hypothetical protein